MRLQAATISELQSIIKSEQSLVACGGGTKPALSTATNGAVQLDMSRLSGIIEYEPGEYTFTAFAGTRVQAVAAELAQHGQYLPFDPLLVKAGATLGGTVAANTSGPGRYRYGGVRDFILGVHFVDGLGQLVRGGGKVVKNSAGFDLPKFMVGSLGRYGIFVDLSFKVFPTPRAFVSLRATYHDLDASLQAIFRLGTAQFDLDVLDLEPHAEDQFALMIRIGGIGEALPGRAERLEHFLKTETNALTTEVIADQAEISLWEQVQECAWVSGGLSLVKAPISPKRIPALEALLPQERSPRRYTAGGNVAWLALSDVEELDAILSQLELAGLVLFGRPDAAYVGVRRGLPLAQRVKQALDPSGKFLGV